MEYANERRYGKNWRDGLFIWLKQVPLPIWNPPFTILNVTFSDILATIMIFMMMSEMILRMIMQWRCWWSLWWRRAESVFNNFQSRSICDNSGWCTKRPAESAPSLTLCKKMIILIFTFFWLIKKDVKVVKSRKIVQTSSDKKAYKCEMYTMTHDSLFFQIWLTIP